MAIKSQEELLLSEIARKLNTLNCICKGISPLSGAIIQDYQPLDCNLDPVGDPTNVIPVITLNKQDMNLCNYQQLADAINLGETVPYNVPNSYDIAAGQTKSLVSDLGVNVAKLHSIQISIITSGTGAGTVAISGNLGGGTQSHTGLPIGVNIGWDVTTTFGTGDMTITASANIRVLILTTSSA